MTRALTVADIVDLRAYERERDSFREHIIALKKRRRIPVGPYVTLLFENRDTIRFQIQEMARVERLITDEAIAGELRAYNPLIAEPGHLCATMFVELTSEALLREWLPKLVGIERSMAIHIEGHEPLRCEPEAEHESFLTRDDITSSVHYVRWTFTGDEIDSLAVTGGRVVCDHPNYGHHTRLDDANIGELLEDLRG